MLLTQKYEYSNFVTPLPNNAFVSEEDSEPAQYKVEMEYRLSGSEVAPAVGHTQCDGQIGQMEE